MGLFTRRRAERQEDVQASAGPLGGGTTTVAQDSRPRVMSRAYGGYRRWQQEVDVYDRYGPGFVGSMLDLVAGVSYPDLVLTRRLC